MIRGAQLVAFVATTDIHRSRAFYVDALGLAVLEETPHALVLDGHGTHLRVTPVEEKAAAPYTVLGWSVDDLASNVSELRESGVNFWRVDGLEQDEYDSWTAPDGTRVAWFADPDGNVLSLQQNS